MCCTYCIWCNACTGRGRYRYPETLPHTPMHVLYGSRLFPRIYWLCFAGCTRPPPEPLLLRRMYTSLKCLIWGEDLASDPVGVFLSVALKWVSHGSLVLDVKVGTGDPSGQRPAFPSPSPPWCWASRWAPRTQRAPSPAPAPGPALVFTLRRPSLLVTLLVSYPPLTVSTPPPLPLQGASQ